MNIVILKGNVGQDPKITNFPEGGKVAQFTLATTERGYKLADGREIEEKTDWHNCVVKKTGLAGVCEEFVKKGTPLLLRGKIETRSYTDQSGATRYITEIIVSDLELLGKKERENAPAPEPEIRTAQAMAQQQGGNGGLPPEFGSHVDPHDDLPWP